VAVATPAADSNDCEVCLFARRDARIGHVTIRFAISYWWFFGTKPLSLTGSEIYSMANVTQWLT